MAKADQGSQAGRQPPAYECRRGRMRGVVWKNDGKDGVWFSVSITRNYQDGDGKWKQSSSFGRDDLLVVAEIARTCWNWIMTEGTTVQDDGTSGTSGDRQQ